MLENKKHTWKWLETKNVLSTGQLCLCSVVQLKHQTDLHQQVYELLNATDKVRLSKKVDVAALEAMAEGDLQSLVSNLEQYLDKMVRFVNDQ